MAARAGYDSIVSHRPANPRNTFIADLVVAMGKGEIKTVRRRAQDRVAKYNQLLRIDGKTFGRGFAIFRGGRRRREINQRPCNLCQNDRNRLY